ncbi:hypothetical protein [Streptomyces acidiscabies]|uniref:hypothetical protein n=1 Tax=Streptomyces acidiscabies TaxID=42234 RepID=UPI0038F66577
MAPATGLTHAPDQAKQFWCETAGCHRYVFLAHDITWAGDSKKTNGATVLEP